MFGTKHSSIFLVIFVLMTGALLVSSVAFAQDEEREAPDAQETPVVPPASASEPQETITPFAPGWMLIQGHAGAGSTQSGGTFNFDDVPAGEDDETDFSSEIGHMYLAGFDFLFFPTSGRRFFLSATGAYQAGQLVMDFDDEEYGAAIGLNNRVANFQMGYLLGGLGYRWLRGDQLQHGITLHTKLGIGTASMAVDGFAASQGGSELLELGTGYHRRFANGMTAGVQFDIRLWGAKYEGFAVEALDNDGDLELGGFIFYWSFVVGWETL